jgi:hypothetical protein
VSRFFHHFDDHTVASDEILNALGKEGGAVPASRLHTVNCTVICPGIQAPSLTAEYHATVESFSDKFQVDIPNVVGARACCTALIILGSDRFDPLPPPSERNK